VHPEDISILPDSSKAFVACTASAQVAALDLRSDKVLALLDVGRTPINLALKPDGGELFVSNFDSSSVSVIETTANEVGGTYLIGSNPARAVVSADNTLLYVSNFGSDSVSVYSIDTGRVVDSIPVGKRPEGLALTPQQDFVLVLDTQPGDVAVVRLTRLPRGNKIGLAEAFMKGPNPNKQRALFTMVPVGVQPRAIVVKAVAQ
jgi:YVTN family beta-propeller protein